jgi:hypothetical protein
VNVWQRESTDDNILANKISMSGKAEVVLVGTGMDLTPENNFIIFTCYALDSETAFFEGFGPELTRKCP